MRSRSSASQRLLPFAAWGQLGRAGPTRRAHPWAHARHSAGPDPITATAFTATRLSRARRRPPRRTRPTSRAHSACRRRLHRTCRPTGPRSAGDPHSCRATTRRSGRTGRLRQIVSWLGHDPCVGPRPPRSPRSPSTSPRARSSHSEGPAPRRRRGRRDITDRKSLNRPRGGRGDARQASQVPGGHWLIGRSRSPDGGLRSIPSVWLNSRLVPCGRDAGSRQRPRLWLRAH